MKKFLMLHGINHNMFGKREPKYYGTITLQQIDSKLRSLASELGVQVESYQTNHEGEMVERVHRAFIDKVDGVIINAGAWTHYSYGLRDALAILTVPIVEIHMSNNHARDAFRQVSVISEIAKGYIAGFGVDSYLLGLRAAVNASSSAQSDNSPSSTDLTPVTPNTPIDKSNTTSGAKFWDDAREGDQCTTPSIKVTGEMIDLYAEVSGDHTLLHVDEEYARNSHFGQRVAHGLYGLSVADGLKCQADYKFLPGMSLGWTWDFLLPIYINDELHVEFKVETMRPSKSKPDWGIVDIPCKLINQHGAVVQRGVHKLMIPRRPSAVTPGHALP